MDKKQKLEQLKALKESYAKTQTKLVNAKKLEESLRATNIGVLLEAELEQAEVILAAEDFLSQLQKMAEDIAKMQAESIPLSDAVKENFGPEASRMFDDAVTGAMQESLAVIRDSKDKIFNVILSIKGEEVPDVEINNDMNIDVDGDDLGVDAEDELVGDIEADDLDDVFGSAEASSGPKDEPLGRGFKESYKSIGKKLLMKESIDSLVNWLFEDVAATMAPAQFTKFAGQVATKGAQDAERLAGWIGSRKYGAGLGAQLSSPMADLDDDILDESSSISAASKKSEEARKRNIARAKSMMAKGFTAQQAAKEHDVSVKDLSEGKSYKANDEDGDAYDRKKSDKARRDAAKSKREVEMAEGRSYRHDDDDDDSDVKGKKKADNDKRNTARAKREVEVTEGKSYKRDDEDGDADDKKKSDRTKRDAAKSKREVEMAESKAHPGFEKVADKIAREQGISKGEASAILAKSSRDASASAKRKNPRLKRVEEAVRLIIERNIATGGKGLAAKAIAEAQSMFPMVESDATDIVEAFEAAYGMTPQAYSLKKAKAVAEATTLSPTDQKNAAQITAQLAIDGEKDKNLSKKGVQQALNHLKPQERTTAQKVINNAKSQGKQIANVGDLLSATKDELDTNSLPGQNNHGKSLNNNVQEDVDSPSAEPYWKVGNQKPSKKPVPSKAAFHKAAEKPLSSEKSKAKIRESEDDANGGWVGKVVAHGVYGLKSKPWKKVFKNGAVFLAWAEKNSDNYEIHAVSDESTHPID